MENMFCYQCQEAAKGIGCTIKGVCGKTSDVANLQDTLLFVLKGISILNGQLKEVGQADKKANKVVFDGLFATITNANFDHTAFVIRIKKALKFRDELKGKVAAAGLLIGDHDSLHWTAATGDEFEAKAKEVGILSEANEDVRSLKELIIYGLKGLAAYAEHAYNLKHEKQEIFDFMMEALAKTTQDLPVDELIGLTLETGKFGVDVMALLDAANTSSYGNPEVSKVNIGTRNNPAILISGHDLRDINKPKVAAWMFTPTAKCFRPTTTRNSRNTAAWPVTTEMPGGNKKKNSNPSTDRFSSPPTVLFRQWKRRLTKIVFTPPEPAA